MRQFWNELNGLAPKGNFWGITESLVKDVFIVNMANKDVQQKLCTESKTTVQETIQFAISYEEGAIKQQSFEKLDKPKIKQEPSEVNNVNLGVKLFPMPSCIKPPTLKKCKPMGIICTKCGKKGHFAKCCQTKQAGTFSKSRKVIEPPAQRIQRKDDSMTQ